MFLWPPEPGAAFRPDDVRRAQCPRRERLSRSGGEKVTCSCHSLAGRCVQTGRSRPGQAPKASASRRRRPLLWGLSRKSWVEKAGAARQSGSPALALGGVLQGSKGIYGLPAHCVLTSWVDRTVGFWAVLHTRLRRPSVCLFVCLFV